MAETSILRGPDERGHVRVVEINANRNAVVFLLPFVAAKQQRHCGKTADGGEGEGEEAGEFHSECGSMGVWECGSMGV